VVGGLVLVSAVVGATVALATRGDRGWKPAFAVAVVELALGVTLIARPGGTVHGVAITLAVIAFVAAADEIGTAVTRGQHRAPDAVPVRSAAPVS
jgi:uncharacterized membrane protein HdeD (DUF308 family)